MDSVYFFLVGELKTLLKKKYTMFRYNDIFKWINNCDCDQLCEYICNNYIVEDDIINTIRNIYNERIYISERYVETLNNLKSLNEIITSCGHETQPSLTQARKLIKSSIGLNIYYLDAKMYHMATTPDKLRKQLKNKPDMRFPKREAKNNKIFKRFLVSFM